MRNGLVFDPNCASKMLCPFFRRNVELFCAAGILRSVDTIVGEPSDVGYTPVAGHRCYYHGSGAILVRIQAKSWE